MKEYGIGILLFFIVPFVQAQDTAAPDDAPIQQKPWQIADQQMSRLRGGTMLVRLKSKNASIEAIRIRGNHELADKVERKQRQQNQNIASAFQNEFDFCPVLFFYSHESDQVKARQFDQVEFLGHDLLPVPNKGTQISDLMIAEFGNISRDTAQYANNYYMVPGENGPDVRTRYYTSTNMGFGALVIKSDQFIQLKRPFPYYVRTFDSLPFKRKPKRTVRKMNRRLHAYRGHSG